MKKRLALLVAFVMAFTIFCIPGSAVAFAEEDENAPDVVAQDLEQAEGEVQAMEAYTITFDKNGGEGTMDPQSVEPGTVTLNGNSFTKVDSNFKEWNTKADGSGESYADKASITISDNITLYAQWQKKTFTVTFTDGQGTELKTETVEYGDSATAPANPSRSGYDFTGWDKAFSNVTSDLTVTAKWKAVVPDKVGKIKSVSCNNKKALKSITVSWSFDTASGKFSGVKVSLYRKSNGKYSKTYTVKGTSTKSQKFTGLSDGTKYTYKVVPYYTKSGTTTNGTAKTGTAITKAYKQNGAYKPGNYEYYYKDGIKQRNTIIQFKDTRYGTSKYSLNHYYDGNGVFRGRTKYMYNKIKNMSSKKYLICIDRTNNVMCVYIGGKGKWRPYKYWSCVTGRLKKSDYHPTPLGTYTVKSRKLTFSGYGIPEKMKNRYSVWYCTRFVGSVFIHSQLYKYGTKSSFIPGGGTMGRNASHGCVRLYKSYSYWVYKNCAKGTKVVVIK